MLIIQYSTDIQYFDITRICTNYLVLNAHLLVMHVLRDYLTSQNSACVLGAGQIALIAGSAAKLISARQPLAPH